LQREGSGQHRDHGREEGISRVLSALTVHTPETH